MTLVVGDLRPGDFWVAHDFMTWSLIISVSFIQTNVRFMRLTYVFDGSPPTIVCQSLQDNFRTLTPRMLGIGGFIIRNGEVIR